MMTSSYGGSAVGKQRTCVYEAARAIKIIYEVIFPTVSTAKEHEAALSRLPRSKVRLQLFGPEDENKPTGLS